MQDTENTAKTKKGFFVPFVSSVVHAFVSAFALLLAMFGVLRFLPEQPVRAIAPVAFGRDRVHA